MTHRFLVSLGLLAAFLGGGCLATGNDDERTGGGTGGTSPDTEPPPAWSSSVTCKLGLVAHEDGAEGACSRRTSTGA